MANTVRYTANAVRDIEIAIRYTAHFVRYTAHAVRYNGTEASTGIMRDLRYAGLPDGTEAFVLAEAESWFAPKTLGEAWIMAAAGGEMLKREFPGWAALSETASGSPAREILARAETFDPDLIILGEPRQKLGERNIFMGQTSQTIMAEARCSVRIARGVNETAQHDERILIGFDGSAGAARAVRSIAARRWPGTRVFACLRLPIRAFCVRSGDLRQK